MIEDFLGSLCRSFKITSTVISCYEPRAEKEEEVVEAAADESDEQKDSSEDKKGTEASSDDKAESN